MSTSPQDTWVQTLRINHFPQKKKGSIRASLKILDAIAPILTIPLEIPQLSSHYSFFNEAINK